ncbi:MAG: lipid biosynthesis B12-binding/radical SAM protein [Syntrophobacteraceae bacterium]
MKVLLVSPNTLREPYPVYPLGLDYVAGAISADHQVLCLDMNSLEDNFGFANAVRAFDPDIIGFSLRNIDNTDAVNPQGFMSHYQRVTDILRGCSHAPIVLGGTGFTLFASELMQLLGADYGIIGEGERLSALLNALEKGENPAQIPGVIMSQTSIADPQPLSYAAVRRFDPQSPHVDFYLRNGGMLNLQTKRGCPFRCVYCSYPYIEGRTMRFETPEQIARTAVALQEAGAKYLFITDSAFNADVAQSLAVARALKKAGLTIPWGAFFAPVPVSKDYFAILADCGLQHVEFGTESLCDEVLSAYRKPFCRPHVLAAHHSAVDAGLHVAHYFLFGGPGETEKTLAESFSYIDTLEKAVLFLFCGMRIFPHTTLYDIALKQGQVSSAQSILDPVFFQPPSISLADIARKVDEHAEGKDHWIRAAGGQQSSKVLARLYRRGHTGPLWEYLIPW